MLHRLKAEESLEQIANVSAGTGTMATEAREELIRELQRAIGQVFKPKTITEGQARVMLESMGIEVNF